MKVGSTPRGSFGIPPHLQPEQIQRTREDKVAEHEPHPQPPVETDTGFAVDGEPGEEEDASPLGESAKRAVDLLKSELGIELSGDDWSGLFYKGYLEKTIVVSQIPDPTTGTLKPFEMTVRTLTADEADEADALFASEARNTEMTVDGVQNRKQMWTFAFAVQKINGSLLCKPQYRLEDKTQVPDRRKTAEAKRKVLAGMAPFILKQASLKYAKFINLIDELVADPKQAFFDKP